MKKIITIALLAFASLTLGAKEIAKNFQTGMSLDETAGIYSLKSEFGIIPLGDLKTARNLLAEMTWTFTNKRLSKELDTKENKFQVKEDEEGMYIIKVGLGVVKVRPADALKFTTCLEARIVKEKSKKVWDTIKE